MDSVNGMSSSSSSADEDEAKIHKMRQKKRTKNTMRRTDGRTNERVERYFFSDVRSLTKRKRSARPKHSGRWTFASVSSLRACVNVCQSIANDYKKCDKTFGA